MNGNRHSITSLRIFAVLALLLVTSVLASSDDEAPNAETTENESGVEVWGRDNDDEPTIISSINQFQLQGSFNSGKKRIRDACAPEDGTCTLFTLCTKESIKTHPNGVVIAGRDNYLCEGMYDICCFADPAKVDELRQSIEEKNRIQVEAEKAAKRLHH